MNKKIKYNMDRLYEAVEKRGTVCVGLDTASAYIPMALKRKCNNEAEAVLDYNIALIEATLDVAACYKVQIAYYEAMGIPGLVVYAATLKYIRGRGMPVISDIKRGDIADTAVLYAKAHYEGQFETDFVTLTPYLGMDSISPWIDWAEKSGKGAFVLMRTSNKGRLDFQDLTINNKNSSSADKKLYNFVGDNLALLSARYRGEHGYGAFGAVIGASMGSDQAAAEEKKVIQVIRREYPDLFFLIPGYGAQGGAAEDAAILLNKGNGGVVNASRSVLKAWEAEAKTADISEDDIDSAFAAEAARKAVIKMRDAIRDAAVK